MEAVIPLCGCLYDGTGYDRAMSAETLHSLTALATLLPAVLLTFRPGAKRGMAFWGSLGLALAGTTAQSAFVLRAGWVSGLAPALWVVIAITWAMFLIGAVILRQGWRLMPLLAPYLLLLGVFATVWQHAVGKPLTMEFPTGWVVLHIAVGVMTYAFLTFSAVAACAAFLQERALKRKRPNAFSRQLPSVADSEHLSTSMLIHSEVVLGIGLLSGMAVEWMERHRLLTLDHKTTLSILAFLVIGALLAAKRLIGTRGRMAARIVLFAYLLLTLAYPGVKFVSEVLLSRV